MEVSGSPRAVRAGASGASEGKRAAAAREQRERLLRAMATVASERGYAATRVADVIATAGLSRNTFYRHFANGRECFIATMEEVALQAEQLALHARQQAGASARERFTAAILALAEMAKQEPAACRLLLVESYGAEPEAIAFASRPQVLVEEMAGEAFSELSDGREMPTTVIKGIVGGLQMIAHARLRAGREHELPELAPQLVAWALEYRPPSRPLRSRPEALPAPPRDPAEGSDAHTRIVLAVTAAVAANGFREVTLSEIAQRAGISFTTFYANFENQEKAFLAAIEYHEQRLMEVTLAAYQQAPDWPRAVGAGLLAFFRFLASQPEVAKIGGLDVYTAGSSVLDRREMSVAGFQALLADGYRLHPWTPPVASEAIGAAISNLFYEALRNGRADRLHLDVAPAAIFLALAPFVSNAQASAIAVGQPC